MLCCSCFTGKPHLRPHACGLAIAASIGYENCQAAPVISSSKAFPIAATALWCLSAVTPFTQPVDAIKHQGRLYQSCDSCTGGILHGTVQAYSTQDLPVIVSCPIQSEHCLIGMLSVKEEPCHVTGRALPTFSAFSDWVLSRLLALASSSLRFSAASARCSNCRFFMVNAYHQSRCSRSMLGADLPLSMHK